MSSVMTAALAAVAGLLAGGGVMWWRIRLSQGGIREQAEKIQREAELEREQMLRSAEVDAREKLVALQEEHERELKRRREDMSSVEKRLRQRETEAERKNNLIEKRERELKEREQAILRDERETEQRLRKAEEQGQQARDELERVAGLSQEAARERIIAAVEDDARKRAAVQVERLEREAREEGEQRARFIVAGAVQRFAGELIAERAVSVVELPSDDMKGRIIGREGRNIRAIEAATGVDVIIDDTPEVVVLSAFNPVRREVARLAMDKLIADGRIHPARIEEVVEKARGEIDEQIQRAGEQATFDLGLHGLHPELVQRLGSLKLRVAGGQNLWNHSVETATLAGMMAAELGLNEALAKRAGLLHDVGKAVEHDVDGDHASVGAEHARRFGEEPQVVAAIAQHHHEQPESVLGVLVQAANSLSHHRPGARREALDGYVKRLEDLERIGVSFRGVERAWAMQSGREVRVMVSYGDVSDQEALLLSGDIARRIEDELTYPGDVKVTVIREARVTEIAR